MAWGLIKHIAALAKRMVPLTKFFARKIWNKITGKKELLFTFHNSPKQKSWFDLTLGFLQVGSRERKYEAWSKGKKKLPEVEVDKEDKAKKEREAEALEDMMNWFERWRRRQWRRKVMMCLWNWCFAIVIDCSKFVL